MAEAQLQQFLEKVRQLNAFVALSEADPALRQELRDCASHHEVVALARRCGFEIGRRWGETVSLHRHGDNLLAGSCPAEGQEEITVLLQTPTLRLERIHSCAASSADGFWYDQDEEEWVLLVQGSARLRFEDEAMDRELNPGDWLLIRAHRRHRLVATDGTPGTIWLALFHRNAAG
ncbi:MAG: Nif11 domain/cupin domain-containing protein [Cyanobacteriota bacterium]|nr:Nif11 domain/cupin domain-containing protein [Cyanobacteriota bacterium]